MMTPPPSPSRYFRDPHHFSSYAEAGEVCPFCGLARPGYQISFYSEAEDDDLDFICEVCLACGKLVARGMKINEATELRPDLRLLQPDLSEAEVETLFQTRASELEQRTPAIMAWQPLIWPIHCGDFCCFIKEAGQLDMERLAPDGDGRAFFETHLIEEGRDDIWETVRPDAPEDNSVGYSVGVYLFQCLECREYQIEWDCN